jgi:DNA-directed RNA polymerase specialized sigma24 family protein
MYTTTFIRRLPRHGQGLRCGQDKAFERLVREHTGRLLAVARRLLGSEPDAQDAVQEAFLSAFKAIGQFTGAAKLSTWLHRIVVNAALMKLRSRRRKPEGLCCRIQNVTNNSSFGNPLLIPRTRYQASPTASCD